MVFIQEPKKGQITITIPTNIARLTGWKKGDELVVIPSDGEVILKRIKKNEKKY